MRKIYFLALLVTGLCGYGQIINFPDANFKSTLVTSTIGNEIAKDLSGNWIAIDANNDDEISVTEAFAVGYLDLSYQEIVSLSGIENFVNLTTLNGEQNDITGTLNLSALPNLVWAEFNFNALSGVNLSGLSALEHLELSFNNIPSIDLGGLPNLKFLSVVGNQITNLELGSCTNLEDLFCGSLNIGSLDLTGLTYLKRLYCDQDNLATIDLSPCPNLIVFDGHGNSFTSLDFSNNPLLVSVICSGNQLASIDFTGLTALKTIECQANQLTSLDVTGLTALEMLQCFNNNLTNLNVTGMPNLKKISADNNEFTTLDVSGLTKLDYLSCQNCQLTSVNLENLPELLYAGLMFNNLTTLDFNAAPKLNDVRVNDNDLVSLFVKNGKTEGYMIFNNNPALEYICADEAQLPAVQTLLNNYGYTGCALNSYCSFTPGGAFSMLNLTQKFDSAGNGCDASDGSITHFKYNITSGAVTSSFTPNPDASFSIPLQAGAYVVTASFEIPWYFSVSPSSTSVSMNGVSPASHNFCISPNGLHQDIEVLIVPVTPRPRPGFDSDYKIIYRNKGNNLVSGSITLDFEDDLTDIILALPAADNVTANQMMWNFDNLNPFETREISYTVSVNSPMDTPAVNAGDWLTTTATIAAASGTDDQPVDNVFSMEEEVVNSFDPNDKTCLEGSVIGPEMIGHYVHYVIRFENTGTFAAENIVVRDIIDTNKFDVTSLVALSASHAYETRVTGNKVEFIFENINLPFDDANNDGYVAFKIKTKPTLLVGDTFSNTASIYFDYNFPIVTNTATTTIELLGNSDFEFSDAFVLYPNPVKSMLNIKSKNGVEVDSAGVYNMLGQLIQTQMGSVETVDVSGLQAGQYFLKVHTADGVGATKFIKQ